MEEPLFRQLQKRRASTEGRIGDRGIEESLAGRAVAQQRLCQPLDQRSLVGTLAQPMESSQDAGPARRTKNQSGGLESGKARTILFHSLTVGSYKENQATGPQNQYPNVIGEQS